MTRALSRRGLLGRSLAAAGAGLIVPALPAVLTGTAAAAGPDCDNDRDNNRHSDAGTGSDAGDDGRGEAGRPRTPHEALGVLKAGNRRWVTGDLATRDPAGLRRRRAADGQHPLAVVFTCIDSRVPPEYVFDQDLGDLFVVRTAGEALDALIAGSVEYGPAHGTPLAVVMGHTGCGAVTATVEAIEDGTTYPGDIGAVVSALTPAYFTALPTFRPGWTRARRADAVARVNVRMAMARVTARIGTPAAGGFYDLRSGVVDFFSKTF